MKRVLLVLLCFSLSRIAAISQTVQADVVTLNPNDKFTYDSQDMPHYGLKWPVDSWNPGGNTAWLSGYAGMKFFTNGQPRMAVNISGNVGIGTTSPAFKLHLHSDATTHLAIGSSTDGYTGGLLFYEQNRLQGKAEISYWGQAANSSGLTNKLSFIGTDHNNTTYTNFEFGRYSIANGYQALLNIDANSTNVGIGTTIPTSKLHVSKGASGGVAHGNSVLTVEGYDNSYVTILTTSSNEGGLLIGNEINGWDGGVVYNSYGTQKGLQFRTNGNNTRMVIDANGNIGVNTTLPTEKLSVNGNIRSKKVIVTQTGWPDYVFDSSYQLPSLDSISTFIQVNKHLPDMPSAATVEKDGHDLGEVQKMLLKKMEEMTLYMIQLKAENELMKKEITELKQKK